MGGGVRWFVAPSMVDGVGGPQIKYENFYHRQAADETAAAQKYI